MENSINIAMADTFMAIFGYKRVSPTDEELKIKYRKKSVDRVLEYLEEISDN